MAPRPSAAPRSGFSLVELMIGVAIIGILAAIAIPGYQRQQLKAKRAEAWDVLDGIGTAEQAYFVANDAWVAGASNPGTSLGKTARAWDSAMSGWSTLGFEPDGLIRCNYIATSFGTPAYIRGDAYCDLDDDNNSFILRLYVANGDPAQPTVGWRVVDATKY